MHSLFTLPLDAVFQQFGVPATFIPQAGDPVEITVLSKQPDTIVSLGDTRIHSETHMFEIRASEIANPRAGDRLIIDGTNHRIQGEPVRDSARLVWTVETVVA
ncbi:MAG: hypothetical protein HQL50_04060 [Magnetococcales bacterium]|nr:hypothetical protein [Magnetococcales bacterium]